jgi:hypothetical protein
MSGELGMIGRGGGKCILYDWDWYGLAFEWNFLHWLVGYTHWDGLA